jgi:1-acyl-sn-glycerol-3-phosphate acyltransferase
MQEKQTVSEIVAEFLSKVVLHPLIKNHLVTLFKIYFRLQTSGVENIPKFSSALIIPNHSGFAGLDAIILAHEVHAKTQRIAKVMTHFLWFISKTTAIPAQRLGFIEATTENGIKLLKENNLVILFPEGEKGNFKPTSQKYQLQEFKRGFVRWAIETQTPIIPTLIIGAEESQLNLKRLELPFFIKKLILPIPLNYLPLPSKWKIIFLPPIHLPYHPNSANDNDLIHEITSDIQEKIQIALTTEIQLRKSVYF